MIIKKPLMFAILGIILLMTGCTFIILNKGTVRISDKDSHDAGTNSRSFDVNISPK